MVDFTLQSYSFSMQHRLPPRRRGQGLVEFALVIPVIVLVLVGVIDILRWLDASHRLSRVAADGARFGSVRDARANSYPAESLIRSHIVAALPGNLRGATIQINTAASVAGQSAISVRVTASLGCFTPGSGSGISLVSESWFPRR